MSDCTVGISFDTEFHVPSDCLREGHISCKVVSARCEAIDWWHDRFTLKVILILRITVREGDLRCSFDHKVVLKETVWVGKHVDIKNCEVQAATCRCVLRRGRVWCSGGVSVKVRFRKHHECFVCCPPPPCDCECSCRSPCESMCVSFRSRCQTRCC